RDDTKLHARGKGTNSSILRGISRRQNLSSLPYTYREAVSGGPLCLRQALRVSPVSRRRAESRAHERGSGADRRSLAVVPARARGRGGIAMGTIIPFRQDDT